MTLGTPQHNGHPTDLDVLSLFSNPIKAVLDINTKGISLKKILDISGVRQVGQSTLLGIQFALLGILIIVAFVGRLADADGLVLKPEVRDAVGHHASV